MSSCSDPVAGRTVAQPPGGSSGGLRLPFFVDVSNSRSARHDAVRVRHQVYCVERGYEVGTGGIETDAHDAVSRHVVLRDAAGDSVGTTRLVGHSHLGFPMEHACAPGIVDAMGLDRGATVEVSRFSLVKGAEAAAGAPGGSMRLALIQGIFTLCREDGHEHWCALMEPSLLRLLRATSIHFVPVGSIVEHRGLRQPCHTGIAAVLERIRREREPLWRYFTAGTGETGVSPRPAAVETSRNSRPVGDPPATPERPNEPAAYMSER